MRACPDCAAALARLDQLAEDAADGSGYLLERELLCVHVAEQHPENLPGPVEGCLRCAEWILYLRDLTGRAAAAGLAVIANQHYAEHLLPG